MIAYKIRLVLVYFLLLPIAINNSFAAPVDQSNINGHFNFLLSDFKENYSTDLVGEVRAKAAKVTDNDLEYGAISDLNLNTGHRPVKNSLSVDHLFVFANNTANGEVQIGNNSDAIQRTKFDSTTFTKALGGIKGRYLQYLNPSILSGGQSSNPAFILIPALPIAHGGYAREIYSRNSNQKFNQNNIVSSTGQAFGSAANATKISYVSSRSYNNWQLAASYSPNAKNILSGLSSSKDSNIDLSKIKNITDIGLNYFNEFDNLGFNFMVAAENAKFDNDSSNKRYDLNAYEIAAAINYFGFTVSADYGLWNKSLQLKDDHSRNSSYYSSGIAYEFGHFATSFTYFNSNFQNNKFEAKSIGFEYKIKKGFTPYIEITKFDFKTDAKYYNNLQLRNRQGYVALTGILFTFY